MRIRRFYGSKMMFILITYDVSTSDAAGRKRLRRVAKLCTNYGVRVQNSVFECQADAAQWRMLKARLLEEIDPAADSLRFYYLSDRQRKKAEHHGAKETIEVDKPLIL